MMGTINWDKPWDDNYVGEKIYPPKGNLPNSGERREFSTGSVRDIRTGKGRFDLISPIALLSIAKRLEDGMDKYGERNWEKGQALMSYLDSALRHIFKFIADTMKGKESVEDHMSAALWNLHSFVHTEEMIREGLLPVELNDLPTPERVGLKRVEPVDHDNSCGDFVGKQTLPPTPTPFTTWEADNSSYK